MIGHWYLLRGDPVQVLVRWAGAGPRNVLVRLPDGTEVVRPFRGLRRLRAAHVADAISAYRYSFANEADLQDGIAVALDEKLPGAARAEVRLSVRDRVDFIVGRVAVEVKVASPSERVLAQLARYAEHDDVDELLLVTTRATHRMPAELAGKPLHLLHLAESVL